MPAYDYAEIVRIAAGLLGREATRQRERDAYDAVFVDEYQDCDPAQESLLLALAGDGRELMAVGDPDQSIYAFRGADVRVLTSFPERFRGPDGSPAPVIALRTCRRSGPVLLAASRRMARAAAAPPGRPGCDATLAPRSWFRSADGPRRARSASASPTPRPRRPPLVADTLRRAHLADGVPWGRWRSWSARRQRQVPLLRRALAAAGVPVTVAGRRAAAARRARHPPAAHAAALRAAAGRLDEETAAELLTGPLGRTDALGLRKLRRARLLERRRPAARGAGRRPADPRDLVSATGRWPRPPGGSPACSRWRAAAIKAGGSAEDVLWAIWDASGLAAAVEQAGGGRDDRPAADRDLDAVLALFEPAAQFADTCRPARRGLFADSLAGQEIAGDTLAERRCATTASGS